MAEHVKHDRRRFLGAAATTLTAASLGMVAGVARAGEESRSGVQPAKSRPLPPFGPVKQIDAGLLNVGYADVGPADGPLPPGRCWTSPPPPADLRSGETP
jgi:hypothetical protein